MAGNRKPLRLLSLDGGGIRGFSELIMIEAILKRVKLRLGLLEMPLPAEYFDLIGGTSAGGLIAIMLGRLCMTIDDAQEAYAKLSKDMFEEQRQFRFVKEGRLDEKVFTSVIRDVIRRKLGDSDAKLRSPVEQTCKAFVCTVCTSNVPQIRRFRSYESADDLEYDCAIWEAARATSAAPTYYPSIEIGPPGRRERFIDGGVGCNNPIFELHIEAESLFETSREVACIISLGTGKRKKNQLSRPHFPEMMLAPSKFKGVKGIVKSFKRMALDSDRNANDMERKYRDVDGVYFRFTVEQGLQEVKLAEPKKLSEVRTQTLAYIDLPDVSAALDRAAAALVGQDTNKRKYQLGHFSLSNKVVIETSVQQFVKPLVEEKRNFYLRWFSEVTAQTSSLHNYRENLSRRFVDTKAGHTTCTWLFEQEAFKDTYNSGTSSVLWLKGHPGSGKSVLASAIIEHLSAAVSEVDHQPPLYYFCHQDPQQTTLKDIVCGLISQMSQWEDEKIIEALERFHGDWPSLTQSNDDATAALLILLQSLLSLSEKKVFVVIDSIGYCAERPPPIFPLISHICRPRASNIASIFFTTRRSFESTFKPPSLARLREQPNLQLRQFEITPENTAADLKAFVVHKVNHHDSALASKPLEQRNEITNIVCGRARGMFLYARLVLDELRGDKIASVSAIKSTLKTLPEGIFRMYERQLQLVASKRKGAEVFWWIYAATRDLSWDELKNGIAIVDGKYEEEELIEMPKEEFVQEICGPLVEICGENKAYLRFIHPTIKELFDQNNAPGEQLEIHLAHPTIATKLLTILSFPDVPDFANDTPEDATLIVKYGTTRGRELHQYAMMNWYKHLKACGPNMNQSLEEELCNFLSPSTSLKWLVAALLMMNSRQGYRAGIYSLVEDVMDCLWSWMRGRKFVLGDMVKEKVEGWGTDFRTLMIDWRHVLEKQPYYIYAMPLDLLPKGNCFREFVDTQSYQSVVRFSDFELRTRSTQKPSWQNGIFAVDETRDFAYLFQQGYLQCYHTGTKLLVAEIPLFNKIYEQAIMSPDKNFLALSFVEPLVLDEYTADLVANIRQGLQLSTLSTEGSFFSWQLENEADLDETREISGFLGVPKLHHQVCVVQLNYQGLSRKNLFGLLPGMSSFVLQAFDSEILWKTDDPDLLAFSSDSSTLATPAGLISLTGDVEKRELPPLNGTKFRTTKVTGDLKSLITIRDRKFIELWDIETKEMRHTTQLTGVGHVLAVSHSGRFVLVLKIQTPRSASNKAGITNGVRKLRPQMGTISIYDCQDSSWLDLLVLSPPDTRRRDFWAFHLSPLKPKFTSEYLTVPKVVIFVPPGWSFSRQVRNASGMGGYRDVANNSHLLVFEGQPKSKGFGTEPILRHMITIPPNNSSVNDSFKFPKILSWSDTLDSALVCFEGQVLPMTVDKLQGCVTGRKNSVYKKDNRSVLSRIVSSALLVTADRQTMYRLQLLIRSEVEPIPVDEQALAGSMILRPSDIKVDLVIESVDQQDNYPAKYITENIIDSDIYFPPLETNHVSLSNDGHLALGSLQFQIGFSGGKLEVLKLVSEDNIFERATKAFVDWSHPFRPENRPLGAFLEVFSKNTGKSSLGIFQKSNIAFANFLRTNESMSNLFVPIVIKTCQDSLAVGQYSRIIEPGEVISNIPREAQCFEVYLTVFDERKGLTWMMHTTTAGPITQSKAYVPEILWAMHPTEPLLAWSLPGHRVRLSHTNSSRHPLNIAEPFDLETDASSSLCFSPSGRYLFIHGRDTDCNSFYETPVDPAQTVIKVFDLKEGHEISLTLSSDAQLSINIDDDAVRIYRVTREDAVEMTVYRLPNLTLRERFILTYIPSDCCCSTCDLPFQRTCDVFTQYFENSISIILSHGPVRISHGVLVGETHEPLILRTLKPAISVDLEENNSLAVDRKFGLSPKLLDNNGEFDLNAFDKYNSRTKGDRSSEADDSIEGDNAELSSRFRLLTTLLATGILNDKDHEYAEGINSLLGAVAENIRHSAIKQPILKASRFAHAQQDIISVEEEEIEAMTNRFEKEATSRLVFGPSIEEVSAYMYKQFKNTPMSAFLPFDTWSEACEMMQELADDSSIDFYGFVDEIFGAGHSGVGCKVPLLIHTFSFPGLDDETVAKNEWDTNEGFDWTLAVDVGWIEEDLSWMFRRLYHSDIINARSWYEFPSLRNAEDKIQARMSSNDTVEDSFNSLFGPHVSGVDMTGGSTTNSTATPNEPTSTKGQKFSASESKSDGEGVFGVEDFDPDNLMETGRRFQNMFKTLEDSIPGAEKFLALRLKALMRMSFLRDIED